MNKLIALSLIGFTVIADVALADSSQSNRCRPVGTYLLDVFFPDADRPFGFKEFLVLNADRTLQESNGLLQPNTPPEFIPPGNPPTTGSDGFGAWKKRPGCKVRYNVLKFVFLGESRMPMEMTPDAAETPPVGAQIGFFKISGVAKIRGDSFTASKGRVKAELILGPDPFDPNAIRIDAGESVVSGIRVLATD